MSSSSDSTMRITGLASGLGTDSIIAMLVAARQAPITKLQTKVSDDETQLAAYTKIQTYCNDLENAAYNLSKTSTWNAKTATSSDETVATATATSSASTGTYKLYISKLASNSTIYGTANTSGSTYSAGSFTLNGATVTISDSSSLSDVVSAINNKSSSMTTPVTASVINNTLYIQTTNAGASNAISLSTSDSAGSSLLQSLGLYNSSGAVQHYTAGADLTGTLNGVPITSSSNSLSSAVTGVTFSVEDTGTTTVKVKNDSAGVETAVTDFLDAYNKLNDYITKNTKVTMNSSSTAVSAGILQGQYYPSDLQTKLFSYMSKVLTNSEVNSSYNNFYKIGITRDDDTGDYSISDSTTFENALSSNFSDVQNLFMGSDSSGYYGISKTMDTYLKNTVLSKLDGSLPAVLDQITTDISDSDDRISDLQTKLQAYETNLYTHYSNMENMVQSWNSSLQYLLSSLGSS